MKTFLFTLVLFFSSCSYPRTSEPLVHMRKSQAIEAILENIDGVNYDESYTEIDRDRLKIHYAKDFHDEVSQLTALLKKNSKSLPNKKALPQEKLQSYQNIIKLLESDLRALQLLIDAEKSEAILFSIKRVKQRCTLCHTEFKSVL